jgi:hypothetical protein
MRQDGKTFRNILTSISDLRDAVSKAMAIPPVLLFPSGERSSLAEIKMCQQEKESHIQTKLQQGAINFLYGIRIIASDYLPKTQECIGHEFNNPPYASNRSSRLWKKLRYGLKRRAVRPIMQDVSVAFLFDENVLSNRGFRPLPGIPECRGMAKLVF